MVGSDLVTKDSDFANCSDCTNDNSNNDKLLVVRGSQKTLGQQQIVKGTSTFQLDSLDKEGEGSDSVELSVNIHFPFPNTVLF